jgi:hypothetical protein
VPKAELALLVALRDIPASPDRDFWDAFASGSSSDSCSTSGSTP